MRYIWEPDDIVSGTLLKNQGTKANNNKYMIASYSISGRGLTYLLVALSDGLQITLQETKQGMARYLNNGNYAPVTITQEHARVLGRD